MTNCRIRCLAQSTIKNYDKALDSFLKFCSDLGVQNIEDMQPQHIRAYIADKQQSGRAPQYINDILRTLRVFFRYAYDEGYVDNLVTERIKNVKQPATLIRAFAPADVKNMIDYYSGNHYIDLRNRLILIILFGTGIRSTELRTITIDDLKSDHIVIHGKGDKERVVPITATIDFALSRYLPARESFFVGKKIPNNLILNRYGRQLEQNMLSNVVKQAAIEGANVSPDVRISPHTCRHTYAQLQVEAGIDIYTLSRLLGHTSIAITQRYLQGFRDDKVLEAGKDTGVLEKIMRQKR